MTLLIPTVYSGKGVYGDFNWMVRQKEYKHSLFIFNDNEEYHNTSRVGAGNAVMRQYNRHSKLTVPRSAGIPTGTMCNGGYSSLDAKTKSVIKSSIKEIEELNKKHKYDNVFYSSEDVKTGKLGTSIFVVSDDVKDYIVLKLKSII